MTHTTSLNVFHTQNSSCKPCPAFLVGDEVRDAVLGEAHQEVPLEAAPGLCSLLLLLLPRHGGRTAGGDCLYTHTASANSFYAFGWFCLSWFSPTLVLILYEKPNDSELNGRRPVYTLGRFQADFYPWWNINLQLSCSIQLGKYARGWIFCAACLHSCFWWVENLTRLL